MDQTAIREQLPALVSGHPPRNVCRFKFSIHDGRPQKNALGYHVDPKPFEGKVVARTDDAIVVKNGRAEFAVLDRSLTTAAPDAGVKVLVTPYIRRRFDGERADTPEVETAYSSEGTPYTVKRMTLGPALAKLPIPEPQCPQLRHLIQQLENLPAPDGFRRITHMLVDAGAKDITWVDPLPANIISTPPEIRFTVSTGMFEGRVSILYDQGGDICVIELKRDEVTVERMDQVSFGMLAQTLERLIDDGRWRLIQVEILPNGRRQTRH